MLVVTGTVEIAPDSIERMKEAARVVARATREEPGCHTYGFWQDLEEPTRFRVYEEWDDRAALEAHFETAHIAAFREAMAGLGVTSRYIVSFDAGAVTPL